MTPLIVGGASMAAAHAIVLALEPRAPLTVDLRDSPEPQPRWISKRERVAIAAKKSAEQGRKRKARKAQRAARKRNRT